MKKQFIFLLSIIFLLGCDSNSISKEDALKLLSQQENYPKQIDYEIYLADPIDANKLIDVGLEKDGYVKIDMSQNILELGSPLISFTEKAKPYLIKQTENDLKQKVQRVKIGREVINEIHHYEKVKSEKSIKVDYQITFRETTPFTLLSKRKSKIINKSTIISIP
ncbi:hypothetical protein [Pedobacter puniceum]|uniref:Uncharacterized protein n=1 Tax=Pedobacter puniceum TaxID=2666136 RepID=A0A7K0FLV9_9SPHI|nr:hypothetical protein [Pedobacter puniceum]MRX46948.1 hypothetical protein [Pedobacter puniceum]